MRRVRKKEKEKGQYLKLSSNYWTSTFTPGVRFYGRHFKDNHK